MRIGVDATCWQNRRGYGRHTRALLGALVRLDEANDYTLFIDSTDGAEALPSEAAVRVVRTAAPAALAASAAGRRSARDLWRMSRALSAPGFDLLLFPTVYTYVPVLSRARKVVMIHDVIVESYPRLALPNRRAELLWKAKVTLGCWQADAIATVSEYARRGIAEQYKISPERVFVVGEASDPIFRPLDHPPPTSRLAGLGISAEGRTVAYVGGFGPHKNLDLLVSVFAELVSRPAFADVRLALVGENRAEIFHSSVDALCRQIERLGLADRVLFTGYLPDEDLVVLLNLATVLVLPSRMEGFGLPAIEAAACGCPVIATTASPLPELLGAGGLFVDPARPADLALALTCVLDSDSLRRQMREAGLAAARRLTWETAARQMMGVLYQVADG
jgi:glycosyltransferase involved in cell wall biosynthesis